MKRTVISFLILGAMLVTSVIPAFASAPINDPATVPSYDTGNGVGKGDDRVDPITQQQRDLKQQAIEAKLNGKAKGKTHEVAKGQYVELERQGEGKIWAVLGEFNDLKHNTIAAPDRSVDNTTTWVSDFDRQHYVDMLFDNAPGVNSMHNFYIEQSANQYTVVGDVTDWVPVPGDAAGYDDDLGGPAVWQFVQDEINGWYDQQKAAGKSDAEINDYLSQFDQWDRYDYNGNGNFDEPDGYIDTFEAIHAGEGNEAGGGVLGDAAIWSHSWYAYSSLQGSVGPDFNKLGGVRVGNSDYWVGKYTIQPENGGVGVFAHEFGHDLGLPDLYDTAGGENGTGFWTLMSSGSWLGEGKDDIGSKPGDMGVWEKFQLGWVNNFEVAQAGVKSEHKIGPSTANTKQAQALFVVLPQKQVTINIGNPFEGDNYYYSGAGDNLDSFMSKPVTLSADSQLTAKVKYNIELDWDYAYVVVSTDDGATWTGVPTNISSATDPNGQNKGNGITGSSRNKWADLTADLTGFTGDVLVGFRYWTDGNTGGFGFMVDNVSINGGDVDGAETDAGWTFNPADGFHVTNGTDVRLYANYYVAEFRQYRGYDSTLQVGPYNFGFLDNPDLQNWVEHFPYQDGLLISYWDTSQGNNNTSSHPGSGLILPVDAHPQALMFGNSVWRNRIQSYDATFGLEATDALTLHMNSQEYSYPSLPAAKVFDDRNSYYDPANPRGSVIVPATGTQIRVQSVSAQGSFMQVQVSPAK